MLKKLTLVNLCKCSTNVYSPKKERENIRTYVVQAARIEYLTFVCCFTEFFFLSRSCSFFFLTFTLIKTKQKQHEETKQRFAFMKEEKNRTNVIFTKLQVNKKEGCFEISVLRQFYLFKYISDLISRFDRIKMFSF